MDGQRFSRWRQLLRPGLDGVPKPIRSIRQEHLHLPRQRTRALLTPRFLGVLHEIVPGQLVAPALGVQAMLGVEANLAFHKALPTVQLFPSAFVCTNAGVGSSTSPACPGDAETLTLFENKDAVDACMNSRRFHLIIANPSPK